MTNPQYPQDPNAGSQPQSGQPLPGPGGVPGQQPGYAPPPGYPAAPPVDPNYRVAPTRPSTVDRAVTIWFVIMGVGLIGDVISIFTAKAVALATAEKLSGTTISPDQVGSPSYSSAIFGLIGVALYLWLTLSMRNGRNWARITLTVFAVLGLIAVLIELAALGILFSIGFGGVLEAVLNIVQGVLIILALVFMYRRESSEFFRASR